VLFILSSNKDMKPLNLKMPIAIRLDYLKRNPTVWALNESNNYVYLSLAIINIIIFKVKETDVCCSKWFDTCFPQINFYVRIIWIGLTVARFSKIEVS